jgi:hypothetical protein
MTLAIMFFYPVHQSLGQINGTMLYATERIRTQVVLGVASMITSIVVTYFVLAPRDAAVPGLGLASVGLALKMVGVQLVQVNVAAYVIARTLKWPFDWWYQPVALLGAAGLGWASHSAATYIATESWPLAGVMSLAGVIYAALVIAFVYSVPSLTGFTRDRLLADGDMLVRQMLAVVRRRNSTI